MRIEFDFNMQELSREEQDAIFRLARDNEVFCKDANGDYWQVLDLTTDDNRSQEPTSVK